MNTRFPARTALVAALALCFGAPAIAADAAPIHLAQASSGGGGSGNSSGSTGNAPSTSGTSAAGSNASAGSNDKASSSPAVTGRPDSQRSVTTNGPTTTTHGSTSGSAMNSGSRSATPSANPGNAGFRNWWNEQAQQHNGRVTRDEYNHEMERRWRELDRDNRGLTPAELDRLHGWNSNVQPGASETHNLGNHPNSGNAQAK